VVDLREEGSGGGEEEVSPCLWKRASKSYSQALVFSSSSYSTGRDPSQPSDRAGRRSSIIDQYGVPHADFQAVAIARGRSETSSSRKIYFPRVRCAVLEFRRLRFHPDVSFVHGLGDSGRKERDVGIYPQASKVSQNEFGLLGSLHVSVALVLYSRATFILLERQWDTIWTRFTNPEVAV
jgi:hypothetical protein